jgi:hypothetical protein
MVTRLSTERQKYNHLLDILLFWKLNVERRMPAVTNNICLNTQPSTERPLGSGERCLYLCPYSALPGNKVHASSDLDSRAIHAIQKTV